MAVSMVSGSEPIGLARESHNVRRGGRRTLEPQQNRLRGVMARGLGVEINTR